MTTPDSQDATSTGEVLTGVTFICLCMIQIAYALYMFESAYAKALFTLIFGFASVVVGYAYWKDGKTMTDTNARPEHEGQYDDQAEKRRQL